MFGNAFNNKTTHRYIAMFGLIFNDIFILNKNTSTEKVPISHGPREKYIDRLKTDDLEQGEKISIKLPRMSYSLTNRSFDIERKLNKNERRKITTDNNGSMFMYTPTPYSFSFELSILTKNYDDMLQITDQILPYFEPNLKFIIKPIEGLDCDANIQLILDNISSEDNYANGVYDNRTILTTISFTLKGDLYKAINNGNVVKNTSVDLDFDGTLTAMSCDVEPFTATEDELHTFIKTIVDGD